MKSGKYDHANGTVSYVADQHWMESMKWEMRPHTEAIVTPFRARVHQRIHMDVTKAVLEAQKRAAEDGVVKCKRKVSFEVENVSQDGSWLKLASRSYSNKEQRPVLRIFVQGQSESAHLIHRVHDF